MTAVTRLSASGAVAISPSLALPILPSRVSSHIAAAERHAEARARWANATPEEREGIFVGPPPVVPSLTPAEAEECGHAEAHMARLMAPPSAALIGAWLAPYNLAVRNPQPPDAFAHRCQALAEMLADTPCGAFTADARRRLAGDFFPSAGEIRGAIAPEIAALKARVAALAAVKAGPPKAAEPEAPPQRTPEDIEAMRAKARALVAELRTRDVPEGPKAVKPSYLSDGQALAAWERLAAQGAPGAETMVAKYRRKMEAQAHG